MELTIAICDMCIKQEPIRTDLWYSWASVAIRNGAKSRAEQYYRFSNISRYFESIDITINYFVINYCHTMPVLTYYANLVTPAERCEHHNITSKHVLQ